MILQIVALSDGTTSLISNQEEKYEIIEATSPPA